jgi:hypothetical protein
MTVARTYAATLIGVAGHVVEVEADLSNGLPGITFTGLPDTTVVEARDRVRAAVVNSGAPWPNRKITLALLPARSAQARLALRSINSGTRTRLLSRPDERGRGLSAG